MASPNNGSSLTGLEPLGRTLHYSIEANATVPGAYTWVYIYLIVHLEHHGHFPDFYGVDVVSDRIAISILMTHVHFSRRLDS